MNEYDTNNPHDDIAELDSFEEAWVDELRRPDPELTRTSDAFVQRVMQEHQQAHSAPAIAGRIGPRLVPFAAAAALALAVYVGWVVLTGPGAQDPNGMAVNPDNPPLQPAPDPPVTANVHANKVQLGKLIAQAQSAATLPASSITETARQTPQLLTLNALIDLVDNPVPDLKELLAPLEQEEDQQSRA